MSEGPQEQGGEQAPAGGEHTTTPFESALEASLAQLTKTASSIRLARSRPAAPTAVQTPSAPDLPVESSASTPDPQVVPSPPAASPPDPQVVPPASPPNPQVVPPALAASVAPSLPSLPVHAVPSATPVPGVAAPAQPGLTQAQSIALQSMHAHGAPPPGRATRRRSGFGLGRTLLLMVLAVVVAGGARYGLDWYERSEAAPAAADDGGNAGELDVGTVDPPNVRFVDVELAIEGDDVDPTVYRAHVDLVTGDVIAEVTMREPLNGSFSYDVDVRGDVAAVRVEGATEWVLSPELVADDLDFLAGPWVATLSDVVPPAAVPFTQITWQRDELLDVEPIGVLPVVGDDDERPRPQTADELVDERSEIADEVTATQEPAASAGVEVRHYAVRIDEAAFRAADPLAHAAWTNGMRPTTDAEFEVWVDDELLVRRIVDEDPDGTLTLELVGASRTSSRFASPQGPFAAALGGG